MEQHNHHCLLTFRGYDWNIAEVRGPLIDVARPVGYGHCFTVATIDSSHVDWNAYCAAARAWDEARINHA